MLTCDQRVWVRSKREKKKIAINNSGMIIERVKSQIKYTEANEKVKRSARADKQRYAKDLAMKAKKAVRKRNKRQLHDTTKKLAMKYCTPG